MTELNAFFPQKDEKWEQIDAKVKRQIVAYDESMMMVQVHFETGGVGPIHYHPHTQATYISGGTFEVTIDGKTKILEQGDSFFVTSNLKHGLVCLKEGMLIDVFSPMRADFIKKNENE